MNMIWWSLSVDAVNSARIQELFEKALKHSYLDQNYKNEYWKMDEITVITNETLEKRFRFEDFEDFVLSLDI